MTGTASISAPPGVDTPGGLREHLSARFREVRRQTEDLAEPLSAEDCQVQSMPGASPTKWHLAHTTWFFETFIVVPTLGDSERFHPQFNYLFNSYYNAVGDRTPRAHRGLMTRPTLDEARAYRRDVDARTLGLLESAPDEALGRLAPLIELGLNHEQQHQELILTDIKHAFSLNPLRPIYRPADAAPARRSAARIDWQEFDGGIAQIGHPGGGFCFDNEVPRHRALLEPYRLAARPVSCGEYLAFIDDEGYRRPEFWLSDGWATVQAQGWEAPAYWERTSSTWMIQTLGGFRAVDPAEPVCHVSYFEADAFARWLGHRLPTEAEWEHAASSLPIPARANLLDSGRFHPAPAPASPGLDQVFGDVWEWTRSAYLAYPGAKPVEGALGEYNGKFMCNQFVLRGGSCATPRSHIRASYRNFFPPDARWQFSGIRLASDL